MPVLERVTHETLVDLHVGVSYTPKAAEAQTQVPTAVSQRVDELLIGATQLHVFFEIFGEIFARVFGGEIADVVEIDFLYEGIVLLIDVGSHE